MFFAIELIVESPVAATAIAAFSTIFASIALALLF
jgi:hypothetical protein